LALSLLLSGCGASEDADVRAGQEPESTEASIPTGTEPVSPRAHPALAMTEEGIFIFGGSSPEAGDLRDGAVVDQNMALVSSVPEGPISTDPTNVNASSLGGGDVLVVGTLCDASVESDVEGTCEPGTLAAARYSIATQSWKPLELPAGLAERPGYPNTYGSVDDGVVIGFGYLVSERDYWHFSSESDTWTRVLPEHPGQAIDACLADGRLVRGVYENAGSDDPGSATVEISGPLGPAESKIALSVPVGDGYSDMTVWCAGGTVLVSESGTLGNLQSIDVASGAVAPLKLPTEAVGAYLNGVWTGRSFVFLNTLPNQPAVEFDPATGALTAIAGSDTPLLDFVWTGERVAGFGSTDGATLGTASLVID